MAIKRIKKEFYEIQKYPPINITNIQLKQPEGYFTWIVSMIGPDDTPYQNGKFSLQITFPNQYPFKCFKMKFKNKVYHPNINDQGAISIGHQKHSYCECGHNWSPAQTVATVLLELSEILRDPNPEDPLVPEIAKLFQTDKKKFNEIAKQWTKKYAD